ncbi:CCA tRNA nucleotidyltransferase [Murimonas intestini]|uniref:tRNA nucleotidyltransferase (CCA-adding enzyme) n=1 Tax=Murimonas intestini TaxID=1337051 RepID=A0AB73T2P6_9FIRM|nr:HD domain-containing protein [Murimonas intestini]MCR1866967.1 HD domain-containing protein [Murimonas intestini]MCR1883990.1 HD domain-containing protein [Murimonas intestini]
MEVGLKIDLPEHVQAIIGKLEEAGYEAYAVGGCVRDSLIGRIPGDWDITTSAKPGEVKALFARTVDTGIQHGTVTVLMDKMGYEVTTYRVDGEYEDGRHPREVEFTASLLEDLKRRDFTINAMAYNDRCGIVDIFGGRQDLKDKIIRCVGDAMERFSEDALRILRAVRFSAQLGCTIAESTRQAVSSLAGNLKHISAERIQAELVKLLLSDNPQYLKDAWELGITAVILPEFDAIMKQEQNTPHHCFNVGGHTLKAMELVKPDKVLRLTMLFHDMGKPLVHSSDEEGRDRFYGHPDVSEEIAGRVMRRLRFDNDTIGKVCRLVKYHDTHPVLKPANVRRLVHKVGNELFLSLLLVQEADIRAQSTYKREEKLEALLKLKEIYQDILRDSDCLSLKDLKITGKDLIGDGMAPGRELGQVLQGLLDDVLSEPEHNTKEYLLDAARKLRRQYNTP